MAYFIPSSIQKRLLRYALSRLELVDTDALDLERLEIGWGRRSTVELQDVGLRIDKLSALLKLPEQLAIEHAKIGQLRITIPADLHTSSVVVEARRVVARVRVHENEDLKSPKASRSHAGSRSRHHHKPGRRKGRQTVDGHHGLEALPNTVDLAKSFLDDESADGKAQLEAALNSQSVDMRASVASSDAGSDEMAAGTGLTFGLPAFLASFLKGVTDRLQIVIQDVSVSLDILLAASTDPESQSSEPQPTSVCLVIQDLDVQEAAKAFSEVRHDPISSPLGSPIGSDLVAEPTKRRITLKGVTGYMITDTAIRSPKSEVFEGVDDTSPVSSRYPLSPSIGTQLGEPVRKGVGLSYSSLSAADDGTETVESQLVDSVTPVSRRSLDSTLDTGFMSTLPRREPHFWDDRSGIDSTASSRTLHKHSSQEDLDQLSSQPVDLHDSLARLREERQFAIQPRVDAGQRKRRELYSPRSSRSSSPSSSISSRMASSDASGMVPSENHLPLTSPSSSPEVAYHSTAALSSPTASQSGEDLAHSQYFSHEEAASIYMSAIHSAGTSPSASRRMPGHWENDESIHDVRQHSEQSSLHDKLVAQTPPTASMKRSATADHNKPLENPSNSTCREAESLFHSSNYLRRTIVDISEIQILLSEDESNSTVQSRVNVSKPTTNNRSQQHRRSHSSFSSYAESTASLHQSDLRFGDERQEQPDRGEGIGRRRVEVNVVGTAVCTADAGICKTLTQFQRKLTAILGGAQVQKQGRRATAATASDEALTTDVSISVHDLTVRFLETLLPASSDDHDTQEHVLSGNIPVTDGLLSLCLLDITVSLPSVELVPMVKVEIGKIALRLRDQDLVSFTQEKSLRTSIDDLSEVRNKDLSLTLAKRAAVTEVHIWVQPMVTRLDMHKVDSTLEAIGGLSGLLELGSSMMSDTVILGHAHIPQPAPRTVRFEDTPRMQQDKPNAPETKVNARLGGATLELLGERCSVRLESSALSAVIRSVGARINVSKVRVEGPFMRDDSSDPAMSVSILDTRLDYLFRPEEADLTRLIRLLTPSNDRFEEEDDFLVDTLLRQRRKGAVLRIRLPRVELNWTDLRALQSLRELSEEMSKLSAVTKYLPEETRPGLLTLLTLERTRVNVSLGEEIGDVSLDLATTEVAHVSAPALIASSVGVIMINWGADQTFIHAVVPDASINPQPMLMARMIEDELEPNVKIKLWNTCIEYTVPLLEAINRTDFSRLVGASQIAQDFQAPTLSSAQHQPIMSPKSATGRSGVKSLRLNVAFRDCAIGLTPRKLPSKALFMLNDVGVVVNLPNEDGFDTRIKLSKAETLIVDDFAKTEAGTALPGRNSSSTGATSTSRELCRKGFVNVCSISAAALCLKVTHSDDLPSASLFDIEFTDELLLLETCADSSQTLIEILSGLTSPSAPSQGVRYRTEITPVQDLMASFLGDALPVPSKREDKVHDDVFATDAEEINDFEEGLDDTDFESIVESSTIGDELASDPDDDADALEESIYSGFDFDERGEDDDELQHSVPHAMEGAIAATPAQMHQSILGSLSLAQLPYQVDGKAKRFDSRRNKYVAVSKSDTEKCPVKVHVKDMHMIWNMYDGYDWERTRDVISQAVEDVEARAEEKRRSRRAMVDKTDDDESVIEDCLFNSIYIGIPIQGEPKNLSRQINHDIDDLLSETASQTASNAPSQTSTSTSRPTSSQRPRTPARKLRLDRSKRHKIAIELRGVSADCYMFPPSGETQSSSDVRVRDFEIFDHVPTSTWKKFLTYMHDAGPREDKKPMVHLEICDVRPVPELTASEWVVRATLLPLRLHVDQDALDFITRFFAFKDTDKPVSETPTEQPFLQRVEIPAIPVKMDYKPHRIDFAGLRSGRTKEFMNFVILDGSDFILKHVCLYGISGLDKMHAMLEDIWMADVKSPQQLPGVLSGLNGVRTLVNMGTGIRDLVQIPIREYKKDGRIVRSISKGAQAFGRTTGGELTRFGAKLAVSAQKALQGAEGVFLGPQDQSWDDSDLDPEEKRAHSHYANQPIGILQGLKGAARSLERDLLVTRDVVIAISGEVRESGSVEGAARAVVRHAPTLILRPMIGATKAVSQTMLGATNTVDPANRRRMEDKYKKY